MNKELAEFGAIFMEGLVEAGKQVEVKDVRAARLAVCLQMMKDGMEPKKAAVQAKIVVVELFAAAPQ